MSNKKRKPNRTWFSFFFGLMLGIALSFVYHAISQHFSWKENKDAVNEIFKPEENDSMEIEEPAPVVKKRTSYTPDTLMVEAFSQDTISENGGYETDVDDVEFTINAPEDEEVLIKDRVLNNRKIKVKIIPSETDTLEQKMTLTHIEVQQWATPIKNSITFHLQGNVLKIKGMDINKIEIHYIENQYYVYCVPHYYKIKNNQEYERLVMTENPTH